MTLLKESTLCPRSKGYVWFVCNKMGGEFRWLQYVSCYISIYRWNSWSYWVQTAHGEISRMGRMGLPTIDITQRMKQYVLKSSFSNFWRFTNLYIYIYIYTYVYIYIYIYIIYYKEIEKSILHIYINYYCCTSQFSVLEWHSLSNNGNTFTNPINWAKEI